MYHTTPHPFLLTPPAHHSAPPLRRYTELLTKLAAELAAAGITVRVMIAPLKGDARGTIKATIKYGGDISYLVDLDRATFVFDSLADMYKGLEHIITSPLVSGSTCRIVAFEDRYQQPLSGGYSDVQLLLSVSGIVCELQVNTEAMVAAKEGGGGHHTYARFRFVHEYLLYAAITADWVGMARLLGSGFLSKPDMVRDKHKNTCLHFAMQHKQVGIVRQLLAAGASPLAISSDGALPFTLGCAVHAWDCCTLLATAMEDQAHPTIVEVVTANAKVGAALHNALAAVLESHMLARNTGGGRAGQLDWSAPMQLITALLQLVVKVDSATAAVSCWHRWATTGSLLPVQAVVTMVAADNTAATFVAAGALVQLLNGSGAVDRPPFDADTRPSPLDIAADPDMDNAPLATVLATLGGCFSTTRYICQVGGRSLAALQEAAIASPTMQQVVAQLQPSPEHRRATVLWLSADGRPEAQSIETETAAGAGAGAGAGLLLRAHYDLRTFPNDAIVPYSSGMLPPAGTAKSWPFPPIPQSMELDFAATYYMEPPANAERDEARDHGGDGNSVQAPGLTDGALADQIVAFLANETPERGPLVIILDVLDAASMCIIGTAEYRLLRKLFARIAACEVRIVLLMPTESAMADETSTTSRRAWPTWLSNVVLLLGQLISTCDGAANATTADEGFDAVPVQPVQPVAKYNGVGAAPAGTDRVRVAWSAGCQTEPRFAFISREHWERSTKKSALLCTAVKDLACNLITSVGVRPADFDHFFAPDSPLAPMYRPGPRSNSMAIARIVGVGFDEMELTAWGDAVHAFANKLAVANIERLPEAYGAQDPKATKRAAGQALRELMPQTCPIHIATIGGGATAVVAAAGVQACVQPIGAAQSLAHVQGHLLVIDASEWDLGQYKHLLELDDRRHVEERGGWHVLVLLPDLHDRTSGQGGGAAVDPALLMELGAVLSLLCDDSVINGATTFLVATKNTPDAAAMVSAVVSCPDLLATLGKNVPYPRLKHFVAFHSKGTNVPHKSARLVAHAREGWRGNVTAFFDGCSVACGSQYWLERLFAGEPLDSLTIASPMMYGCMTHVATGSGFRQRFGPSALLPEEAGCLSSDWTTRYRMHHVIESPYGLDEEADQLDTVTFGQCAPPLCLFLQRAKLLLSEVGASARESDNDGAQGVVSTIARRLWRGTPYWKDGDSINADEHVVLQELLEDVDGAISDMVEVTELAEAWFKRD